MISYIYIMNVICSCSSSSVIISSMLVMIGHVKRDKAHVLICCAYIRGCFKSPYNIDSVGDVDWVCLAADRRRRKPL